MRPNDKADSKTSFIVSKIYCLFPTQCSLLKYYFFKTTCRPYKIQTCLQFTHRKSTLVQALHLMIFTVTLLKIYCLQFQKDKVEKFHSIFDRKVLYILKLMYHIKQMYVETYKQASLWIFVSHSVQIIHLYYLTHSSANIIKAAAMILVPYIFIRCWLLAH